MDLAEFILLELLRTETISHEEIKYLKDVFDSNNTDQLDTIEYDGVTDGGEEDFC